jgi:hypothetical protein
MSCLGGALLSLLKSGLLSLSVFFTYMYMNNLATTYNHLPLTQLSEPLFSTRRKEQWDRDPRHHGSEEIPPPPAKKSCMDGTRNAIARTATRIRTGHWRSAVYLKRIRKRTSDLCWFCKEARMTRSHALLQCPNATLAAARVEAWEGRNPGGIRGLLSNPRWERRLMRFLELSGVGRLVEEKTKKKPMRKKWTSGLYGRLRRGGQGGARTVDICRSLFLIFASISFVRGTHTPRIAHSARWGWRISFVWASRRGDSRFPLSFVVYILLRSEGTINEIQTKPNQYKISEPGIVWRMRADQRLRLSNPIVCSPNFGTILP